MILVDSCGWLEFLTDGPLADEYALFFEDPEQIVTPTIVLYEVTKKIQREKSKDKAQAVAAQMVRTTVVDLDAQIALLAADISLQRNIPVADAIVYATAQARDCQVATSDRHFLNLPQVLFMKGQT